MLVTGPPKQITPLAIAFLSSALDLVVAIVVVALVFVYVVILLSAYAISYLRLRSTATSLPLKLLSILAPWGHRSPLLGIEPLNPSSFLAHHSRGYLISTNKTGIAQARGAHLSGTSSS